jgi:hypothetical protein
VAVVALLAASGVVHLAHAEELVRPQEQQDSTEKSFAAARTHNPPTIDGKLDDPCWQEFPADSRFTQSTPAEGAAPSQKTEVHILYDDDAIYVGARLWDDHADQIVSRLTRRDRDNESDWFAVFIDSRHDRTNANVFVVNVAGVQQDGIFFNEGDPNMDWDAVWASATSRDDKGWTVEMRIPLTVFRFADQPVVSWGLNVGRYISRYKEQDVWSFWPSVLPGFVNRFGHMDGLAGLHPRRTFELRPFVVAQMATDTQSGGTLFGLQPGVRPYASVTAGVDFKLGLTSDLTLDGTINPDFGQVEADQVVLNLSRFETFFPEKRPFFLEGVELFQTPIQLFYSRRIGRPPSGFADYDTLVLDDTDLEVIHAPRSLPIYAAAKVTGKVSSHVQTAFLEAVTGPENIEAASDNSGATRDYQLSPARSFSVARARYDFGAASNIGVMATAATRLGDHFRLAALDHDDFAEGVDGVWVLDRDHAKLTGQVAFTERVGGETHQDQNGLPCPATDPVTGCAPITRADGTRLEPGTVGVGMNALLNLNYTHFIARANYYGYTGGFDANTMGFVQPYNQQEIKGFAGYQMTKPAGPFHNWDTIAGVQNHVSFDGVLTDNTFFYVIEGMFNNFWNINIELDATPGWIYDIYETYDGARWEKPFNFGGSFYLKTDTRKALDVVARGWLFDAGDGYDSGASLTLDFNAVSQLDLAFIPEMGLTRATRFYSCTNPEGTDCSVDDVLRHYRFADLNSGYLSFTLRATWTFSPHITLQAYAQLFMDRGRYSDYRDVDVMATERRPIIKRDMLVPSMYAGDSDGDGVKDDDFQDLTLNVNIVLRWELFPGTTLIGVFTRAQSAAFNLNGREPRFGIGGLSTGPTEDLILWKLVYFLG